MKKIVFLDEYSVAGRNLEKITSLGDYTAYENTSKEQVVERLKGAEIAITNKVVIDRNNEIIAMDIDEGLSMMKTLNGQEFEVMRAMTGQ